MAGSANAGVARRRAARVATVTLFSIDIPSPEGRNNFSPADRLTLQILAHSRCRNRAVLKAPADFFGFRGAIHPPKAGGPWRGVAVDSTLVVSTAGRCG